MRDFLKRMDIYGVQQEQAITRGLMDNALHLEQHAKIMAPVLEGHLEGGIQANTNIKRDGKTYVAEVHAGTDSLSAPYALRRHEDVYDPGPLTRLKPPDAAGPAGRKYLARPLIHYMKLYSQHIASKLKAIR
jgi:hypothetical protein